ncbi:hypothetical protein GJ496_002571 [Pomphorhynchus laevis]|nr:hypothetical protein GJ496_002571 [Pomphorhynchus laevis]
MYHTRARSPTPEKTTATVIDIAYASYGFHEQMYRVCQNIAKYYEFLNVTVINHTIPDTITCTVRVNSQAESLITIKFKDPRSINGDSTTKNMFDISAGGKRIPESKINAIESLLNLLPSAFVRAHGGDAVDLWKLIRSMYGAIDSVLVPSTFWKYDETSATKRVGHLKAKRSHQICVYPNDASCASIVCSSLEHAFDIMHMATDFMNYIAGYRAIMLIERGCANLYLINTLHVQSARPIAENASFIVNDKALYAGQCGVLSCAANMQIINLFNAAMRNMVITCDAGNYHNFLGVTFKCGTVVAPNEAQLSDTTCRIVGSRAVDTSIEAYEYIRDAIGAEEKQIIIDALVSTDIGIIIRYSRKIALAFLEPANAENANYAAGFYLWIAFGHYPAESMYTLTTRLGPEAVRRVHLFAGERYFCKALGDNSDEDRTTQLRSFLYRKSGDMAHRELVEPTYKVVDQDFLKVVSAIIDYHLYTAVSEGALSVVEADSLRPQSPQFGTEESKSLEDSLFLTNCLIHRRILMIRPKTEVQQSLGWVVHPAHLGWGPIFRFTGNGSIFRAFGMYESAHILTTNRSIIGFQSEICEGVHRLYFLDLCTGEISTSYSELLNKNPSESMEVPFDCSAEPIERYPLRLELFTHRQSNILNKLAAAIDYFLSNTQCGEFLKIRYSTLTTRYEDHAILKYMLAAHKFLPNQSGTDFSTLLVMKRSAKEMHSIFNSEDEVSNTCSLLPYSRSLDLISKSQYSLNESPALSTTLIVCWDC